MDLSASEIADAVGGALIGPDVICSGASIDSRSISPGQLFVPIHAARDGHDFLDAARAAGAAAYVTERQPEGGTAIQVADTGAALTALGRLARQRFDGPVIGITGSVGKTSVKDLAKAAVGGGRSVHASRQSFNNELGVPLTLINAPSDTEVLIVEMGARGIGHIAELSEIAKPTIGIVTSVGAVHTSEFGSVEAVAIAKGELIEALPANGLAILNADNAHVMGMAAKSAAPVTTYGTHGDITAKAIELDHELRPSFTVRLRSETGDDADYPVSLVVHGLHQVSNALAALAAAQAVAVSAVDAVAGLETAELSRWRMELSHTASGATVINDAYNANALSTEAALRSLAALDAKRPIAVLGLMAELGDRHNADHQAMAALCVELGIDLIAYREPAYGSTPVESFDEVLDRLGPLNRDCAVLVKGSRVAELESLAALLV